MKSIIKVLTACLLCLLLGSCGSVSLLITEKSTSKAAFDEAAFDEEFYRTSVPDETQEATVQTEEQESSSAEETETASVTSAATTAKETVSETASSAATTAQTTAQTTKSGSSITLPTKPSTTAKTVVDTKVETKETKSDLKYGVKQINVVTTYYDIYSDGSKVQTDQKSYVKYDTSGYKATTNDLLPEAKSNKASNLAEIKSASNAVNGYRSGAGASALTFSDDLSTAASVRATEMAYSGKLSSTRPGGSSYSSVLQDMGIEYKSCIELTCKGYTSGEAAMAALKSKTQNLSIMTSGEYKKIGVGVAKSPDGVWYWSLILTD